MSFILNKLLFITDVKDNANNNIDACNKAIIDENDGNKVPLKGWILEGHLVECCLLYLQKLFKKVESMCKFFIQISPFLEGSCL